jgi:hypothetical protein
MSMEEALLPHPQLEIDKSQGAKMKKKRNWDTGFLHWSHFYYSIEWKKD